MKKIVLLTILFLSLGLMACSDSGVDYPVNYYNATITASSTSSDEVTFTIESTGFYDLVALVTVKDGIIISYTVTDHEESTNYGGVLIDDGDFISDLIEANGALSSSQLDAYAGATATRDALVDIAKAALEHYNAYYA
jgi:hypothetical protein